MNKIYKNWTVHNIIGHPLSEIFWLIGLENISTWIHDVTLPEKRLDD